MKYSHIFNEDFEKSILTRLLAITFGIFFISLIIWNRAIRERLPREIGGEVWSVEFWLVLSLFILFFAIFWTSSVIPLVLTLAKKNNKFCIKIWNALASWLGKHPKTKNFFFLYFNDYILNAPYYLWNFIYLNLHWRINYYLKLCVLHLGFLLLRYFPPQKNCNFRIKFITVLFEFIPQMIVYLVFLYEIAITQELDFFYRIVIILLISFIFKAFRTIFYDVGKTEQAPYEAEGLYEITAEHSINKEGKITYEFTFYEKEDKIYDENSKFWISEYLTFFNIQRMMVDFLNIKDSLEILSLIIKFILMLSLGIWLSTIIGFY